MLELWSNMGAGTQMIVLFFLLLALRLPVAFALGLSAFYAMWSIGFGLEMAGDLIATGIAKYSLLAIPFFILAGTLMGSLGIAERMIRFFRVLIGGLPEAWVLSAPLSACSGARSAARVLPLLPPSAR
ncbi:TRAP transporter large permease subunit [Pannonibacter sp. Pt2-lr]